MTSPLRILQLSDCHVSAEPGASYRGINPRGQFEKLFSEARRWNPDVILLSGDLAEDASALAYQFLNSRLERLGAPVHAVPGNHDEPLAQKAVFPSTPRIQPRSFDHQDWRFVLLNSAVPGRISGRLENDALVALDAGLSGHDGATIVVLHHQPVPVVSPWIDRYALENQDEFNALIARHNQVRAVLWGHVHQEHEESRGATTYLGCPSTAVNSTPGAEKFTDDGKGPAARWLLASPDGTLETGILRAGGD